jgi:hypothetical protein
MTAFSQPERRGLERMQVPKAVPHPDADLLTAFAEHSLTAREQEQVLGHLAACASCRDVLALSGAPLMEAEPVPEPLRRRAFWEMPLFRWGAMAATAVVVVGAVTIGVYDHQAIHPALMTKEEAPPVIGADRISSQPKLDSAEKENAKKSAPAKRAIHLQQEVRFERPATEAKDIKAKSGENQIIGGAVGGPLSARRKDASAGSGAGNFSVTAVAPAPPPPPPSRDTNANLDKAFTASAGLPVTGRNVAALGDFRGSLPGGQRPVAKTSAAEAKAQPVAPKTQASADSQYAVNSYPADETAFAQNQSVEMNAAPVPQAAPPTPSQQSDMMTKVQSRAKAGLFHEVRPIESIITGTEWQITREGELQRSFSRGNFWETMLKGSQFRSVAVVRDHIWAGGDDGSLSFSADNGLNWSPMPVRDANSSVTGNVVRLRFDDAQNGSLDTSTGETWKTNDGGQTWHKQQ